MSWAFGWPPRFGRQSLTKLDDSNSHRCVLGSVVSCGSCTGSASFTFPRILAANGLLTGNRRRERSNLRAIGCNRPWRVSFVGATLATLASPEGGVASPGERSVAGVSRVERTKVSVGRDRGRGRKLFHQCQSDPPPVADDSPSTPPPSSWRLFGSAKALRVRFKRPVE